MPQDTKLELSAFQLETLKETRFFDNKREVTRIISSYYNDLQLDLVKQWNDSSFPELFPSPPPKIFKGENYRGYPYVNMDFPRAFQADSIFAFRSMFWWGNHFSFTVHLQGAAFERIKGKLEKEISALQGKGYYLCVNESPWEYHFGVDNAVLLDEVLASRVAIEKMLRNKFIKISRKLPLNDYREVENCGSETFRELLRCLE